MGAIREWLKKPAVGWTVAGLAVVIATVLFVQSFFTRSAYDLGRMQENVTIRFMDTGEEISMPRGRFEVLLRESGRVLKPDEGLMNPKTGKPTGILVAQREWEETVERLNRELAEVQSRNPFGSGQ